MAVAAAPEACPWVAYALPAGEVGTLAVFALSRGEVFTHARAAAQLALGYREGRTGPSGSFVYGHATTDMERAIMARCPTALGWICYRHAAAASNSGTS